MIFIHFDEKKKQGGRKGKIFCLWRESRIFVRRRKVFGEGHRGKYSENRMENGEGKKGKYLEKEINLSARRQRIERGIGGLENIWSAEEKKNREGKSEKYLGDGKIVADIG